MPDTRFGFASERQRHRTTPQLGAASSSFTSDRDRWDGAWKESVRGALKKTIAFHVNGLPHLLPEAPSAPCVTYNAVRAREKRRTEGSERQTRFMKQ